MIATVAKHSLVDANLRHPLVAKALAMRSGGPNDESTRPWAGPVTPLSRSGG